jgi:hypothetical protein
MNRSATMYSGFFAAVILFLANASGVPQAVTGAPGESGLSCNACHSGGNFSTQIRIDLLQEGNPVNAYQPGESYQLRVQVSGQNNPKSFGYELVCLKASDNSDLGVWSQLGDRVRTRTMLNRVYLQQSAPKTDGIFTANWKAPLTDVGPVNFYFSGLAVNLNGTTSGDQHAVSSFTLTSSGTSSSNEITSDNLSIKIHPVPSSDFIFIDMPEAANVKIIGMNGSHVSIQYNAEKGIDISALSPGIYFVRVENSAGQYAGKAKFIKI